MPATPDEPAHPHRADAGENTAPCARERECRCARARKQSDLHALLADPGFRGTVIGDDVVGVGAHLPLLDQVVGVTVAGPVIVNDVGVYAAPVVTGGPIRCRPSQITLRIEPSRLGTMLVTEPEAHTPGTLRMFDREGNTAHATYLTEGSDRLGFEAITLSAGAFGDSGRTVPAPAPTLCCTSDALEDQVTQLDDVLTDGGVRRLASMPAYAEHGYRRVETRRVVAALEHAALHALELTVVAAAPGCLQMHHDRLDAAREHRGQMILASGSSRAMINFGLVAQCWVTWSQGVWGPTASIELYDRHARCSMLITQTGPVEPAMFWAWDQLLRDVTA
ncbi:heme transporter [Gordonia sp. NPDC003429]